ncbi:hypothetical protein ACKUSY_15580 [Myroides odoratus]
MKRKLFAVAFLMGCYGAYCQVGIGTRLPNSSSELDVVSGEKGVLIPRVSLLSTKDIATIKKGSGNGYENSLLVFNTLDQNDVTPGYYYWYQDKWIRIVDQRMLDQYLKKYGGNVYYEEEMFTYVDENGDIVNIDVAAIVKAHETITTLVKDASGNGQYTYKNEAGLDVIIDVPLDVVDNLEEILENPDVQILLNQYLREHAGNVYYDGNSFTYVKLNGDIVNIDVAAIVKAHETITTLVKDASGNGQYTYKNEAGLEVIIDVPLDVVDNFEEILENPDVQILLNRYLREHAGNVYYDGNSFTYVKLNGDIVNIDVAAIVKAHETITTLVKNASGNGQYTYKNEAGLDVIIDVPLDVVDNFEEILENPDVQILLNQYLREHAGNVYYDGNSFTYVKLNGDIVNIDVAAIVKAHETITTLVKDASGNGQYTYKNEAGLEVIIDVPLDVVDNFEEILENPDVQILLNQYLREHAGNVYYDGNSFTYVKLNGDIVNIDVAAIVKAHETITTLVKNASGNGQYTYKNEAGLDVIIDVPLDVVDNFEEILENPDVQILLNQYLREHAGNVYYDGNSFTYVKLNGDIVNIDVAAIVKAHETITTLVKDASGNGQYTYKNEAGLDVIIDVPLDVVDNFEEILENPDVQILLNQYLREHAGNVYYDGNSFTYVKLNGDIVNIDVAAIVKAHETITTLVKDASGNGQYTYKNEAGTEVAIDVTEDVIVNFETIIEDTNVGKLVKLFIINSNTITEVSQDYVVLDLDTTIIADAEARNLTITLPAATPLNKGRILKISKIDESAYELRFSEQIIASKMQRFTSLNYATTISIQSNGAFWYLID